ncbi:MAG: dTMP kinase [Alphaproteobacteria bacterium RIFCSPHIGHO2_02_FULL_46_13]|nr:MAG: dTMP kinase [Alphaproteobacteria bacterium RIFCSPHIGHO2_02_FULL_46_13]
MMKGLFITLEGGEGAGKSTQSRRLKSALESAGRDVVLTREPGGTPEAEKIRDLLVQRDGGNWTPMAECLLFFAARQMHVETLIKPAIAAGKIVICDRFTDSTIAYQGYGHGFDISTIQQVAKLSLGDFKPDLTFILDLPVADGLARSLKQKDMAGGKENTEDRFKKLKIDFHEKLRQGFLTIAKHEPSRCVVVDAGGSADDVYNVIWTRIQNAL